MKICKRYFTLFLLGFSFAGFSWAQDVPGDQHERPLTSRTSPFAPPDKNDRTFSTDKAPMLDTGCIYRSSGPIIFNIDLKRYLGPVDGNGKLQNYQQLISKGLISPDVLLTMPAFDVDSSGGGSGVNPELDKVSVNGFEVGYLRGVNGQWVNNSFRVPIEKIKFADRGANGGDPTGGRNEIRIDIDTANSSESWCTSIDWGAVAFKAMSPVILVHGNGSNGGFYERQGFTDVLESEGIVFDNSVNLIPKADLITANGMKLDAFIPRIVKELGATNVHLVAHSKGGLDTREYLAKYQRNHDRDFKILSFTTLSTPHNGSIQADFAMERENASNQIGILGSIEYQGIPAYAPTLAAMVGTDVGTTNLTTQFLSGFNGSNVPVLDRSIAYSTVGADMDLNTNGTIQSPEYAGLRSEKLSLTALWIADEPLATRLINGGYQNLKNVGSVTTLAPRRVCIDLPFPLPPLCRTIMTIVGTPNASPVPNDFLVSIPSAHGVNAFGALVNNRITFTGTNGRDHSTIANGPMAETVWPRLVQIDRLKGGLR